MTPFNGTALLVMLLTFYPTVSGAELLRARRERPDYFAGGTIIGRHFDALRLPDGRVIDLIFNVDGPAHLRRWQVLDVTHEPDAPPDPFALEDGPLSFLDEDAWPAPAPRPEFEPIVAAALDELGASPDLLAGAETRVVEGLTPAAFDAAVTGPLEEGAGAVHDGLGALLHAVPADVLDATNGRLGETFGGEGDAAFDPPPLMGLHDPGEAPRGPGDGFYDPREDPEIPKEPIPD